MKIGPIAFLLSVSAGVVIYACNADLRDNDVCVMYHRALCNKAADCGYLGSQTADQCLAPYLDDGCKDWSNSDSDPDPRACGADITDATCASGTPLAHCGNDAKLSVVKRTITESVMGQEMQREVSSLVVTLTSSDPNSPAPQLRIDVTPPPPGSSGAGGSPGEGAGGSMMTGSGGNPTTGSGGKGGTVGSGGGSGGNNGFGGSAIVMTGSGGNTGVAGSSGVAGGPGFGGSGGRGGAGGMTGVGGAGGKGGGTIDAGPGVVTCASFTPDPTYPCAPTAPPPPTCANRPVSCTGAIGGYCPVNSSCVFNTQCTCTTGYMQVSCATGRSCTGDSCPVNNWGCVLKPVADCLSNPQKIAGTCKCSNGAAVVSACGAPELGASCEALCESGFFR